MDDKIKDLRAPQVTDWKIGDLLSTKQAMKIAIAEAYKGASFVSPNPLVGCVVLDSQGKLLSIGYHQKYGEAHAEVNAVKGLSHESLKGAHVIVTLEPCAHEGKTPSCAKMLAQLPIKKVTYGLVDPNPLVAGQGAEILKSAGIEAELFNELQTELNDVCEAFLWNFRQKKIFVSLKLASSLDGVLALENGDSRWITNQLSRQYSHYLRSCSDAVLIGSNTFKYDNPSLNIRLESIQKENKVVLLDTKGESLKDFEQSQIYKVRASSNIFICVSEENLPLLQDKSNSLGINLVGCKLNSNNQLCLNSVLDNLYKKGLRSVFVEGGAAIASEFLKAKLVHRLYLFQAPKILGQQGGRSWTQSLQFNSMEEVLNLKNPLVLSLDQDILWTGQL